MFWNWSSHLFKKKRLPSSHNVFLRALFNKKSVTKRQASSIYIEDLSFLYGSNDFWEVSVKTGAVHRQLFSLMMGIPSHWVKFQIQKHALKRFSSWIPDLSGDVARSVFFLELITETAMPCFLTKKRQILVIIDSFPFTT